MIKPRQNFPRLSYKKKPAAPVDPFFLKSKARLKKLNIFWLGFIVYNFGFVYTNDQHFVLSASQLQATMAGGLVLIGIGVMGLMKYEFDDKYLKSVFAAYMILSVSVVVRGFHTDFDFVKKMLFNPYYGMLHFFLPLIVLLPRNIQTYKKVFDVLFLFAIFFFILLFSYSTKLFDPRWDNEFAKGMTEILFQSLTLPLGFILLTFFYHTKSKVLITFLVFLVTIYFLILRARRGSLFVSTTILLSALLLYLNHTKKSGLAIALLVFLVPVLAIYLSGVQLPSMFDFLMARGTEDTRSSVEQYMSVSMSSMDWIIGKGIRGSYYCPLVINMETMDYTRDVVETGYLQIVLKGGYLSLYLLFAILIPAVYKGFSDSKNLLTKAAATLIILWILSLFPLVVDGFAMQYALVWIAVGICYSKKIRHLSDRKIKAYLTS